VAAWGLLALADWHWVGTLLAFGPRWVMLMVVGIVAIGAAFWRPGALLPLGAAGAIVAGPVMGLCVSVRTWLPGKKSGMALRVLTCNTLVGRADSRLARLIAIEQPDVVALQEWPEERPLPCVLAEGWHVMREQGLVLASRLPIAASQRFASPISPSHTLGLRCELRTADGSVQFCVLHLRTPRKGLEAVLQDGWDGLDDLAEVTAQRRDEGAALGAWLRQCEGPLVVAGDFNLAPESSIYRGQFGWLQNAFSMAGWGWGATKVTRYHGVRIDHILGSRQWRFVRCNVGPDVGSDHRPVVAEMVLSP
jgi:vancomycin resistance protein VanJ